MGNCNKRRNVPQLICFFSSLVLCLLLTSFSSSQNPNHTSISNIPNNLGYPALPVDLPASISLNFHQPIEIPYHTITNTHKHTHSPQSICLTSTKPPQVSRPLPPPSSIEQIQLHATFSLQSEAQQDGSNHIIRSLLRFDTPEGHAGLVAPGYQDVVRRRPPIPCN